MRLLLLLPLLPLLAGCPLTDDKDDDDDEDEDDGVAIDLILIVDASSSMQEEASALAAAVDTLTAELDGERAAWRIGVTTPSVYYDQGATAGIDPGEAGTLVGDQLYESADDVREAVLCGATCWDDSMPSDADYVCGDPAPAEPSEEYLDCTCGVGAWSGNCGTGTEEGLEAMLLTLCRAADAPPEDCYLDTLSAADDGSNPAMGEGAALHFLLVSDEGDASRRSDGAGDTDVTTYLDLYDTLGGPIFSMVGPQWDGMNGDCLDGAQTWGVDRYQTVAGETGGAYLSLTDASCGAEDMNTLMEAYAGELLEPAADTGGF